MKQAVTAGISHEAVLPYDAGNNVLAKLHGKITQSSKYGREATADITYNGEHLLSTEMAGVAANQPDLNLYSHQVGFLFFNNPAP